MIQHVKILQGHEGAIYKLHFDALFRKLYSVGGDGWLVEWDVDRANDGVLIARVPDQVFTLSVSPFHYLLGSFQGNFYVISRTHKTILHQERAHQHGIFSILSTDNAFYSFGGDGKIVKWDSTTFEKLDVFPISNKSLRTHALNPAGDTLAVGGSDGSIYILSFPEMYLLKQIESAHDPSVFSLVWADNRLISGGRDALLKTWDITLNYSPELSLNAHWYAIYDLLLTPDHLVTASRDKTIRWWDRNTLKALGTIKWGDVMEAHVHSVNTLAYDEMKNELYSGSEDRTIRVWNMDP